ncbi:MAG: T9SS type A sorting domain-containing protein [bacterium]
MYLLKISVTGALIWQRAFGGRGNDRGHFVQCAPDSGFILIADSESFGAGDYDFYVINTDSLGIPKWQTTFGGSQSDKGRFIQCMSDGGYIAGGRTESFGSGEQDIYLVRLEPEEIPLISVNLEPTSLPVLIPSAGGNFDFLIEITNNSPEPQSFDLWSMITSADGRQHGPLYEPLNLTLGANFSRERSQTQTIPGSVLPGVYTYSLFSGHYPDTIWNSSSFPFEKVAASIQDDEAFSTSTEELTVCQPVLPELHAARPNPFNPTTELSYELRVAGSVLLSVYDIQGREVAKLVDGFRDAGVHEATFDATGLTSGVYLVKLIAGDQKAISRIILMK